VVRRPAALLAAVYGATLSLLLSWPFLPAVGGTSDLNTALSDITAMLLLVGCVLALLPGRDSPVLLVLVLIGAGLLAGAFTVAGMIAFADLFKALFAGSLGMVLASLLAEPAIVVAVPLFAAALDVFSVSAGPARLLIRDGSQAQDFLTLYLPAIGGERAGVLGVADLVFVGFFAASAWRFGLRRRATAVALLLALPVTLLIQLATDGTVPALPALAAALLVPNLDLLPGLLRRQGGE
jgi:hypothetical protein